MRKMWLDDCRPAPNGWYWITSVNEAKIHCCQLLSPAKILPYEIISLDHDAGDKVWNGGDYIEFLKWLEKMQMENRWDISQTKFHIHSMNPVGIQNMRAIIQHNRWEEIR